MNANPLNILHTIGLKTLYPVIRCQLQVAGQLDIERLRHAVDLTAQVIPELYCRYRLKDNSWEPVVHDARTIVQEVAEDANLDATPDWFTDPQLRVLVQKKTNAAVITVTISHILTDGSGFKQFLYLLCDCYNRGVLAIQGVTNVVRLDWLQALLKAHPQAEKTANVDHPAKALSLPKLTSRKSGRQPRVSGLRLNASMTAQLLKAAHEQHVTVNDILLATFGKVIQAYNQSNPQIAIACPTDMRQRIHETTTTLRVANHTARYNPQIFSDYREPVRTTVQKMHTAMQALKQRDQFLDSVRTLMNRYESDSLSQLQQIVEDNYHVRAIGYTNFGVIDDARLRFTGAEVRTCLLTGSFREAPMFQVACSTFRNQLSLGFNMIGTDEEVQFGRTLIQSMVVLIQEFIQTNSLVARTI